MTTEFITRFAPSPTGRLHLGHIWSAMHGFDMSRAANGRFFLRIEDIDQGRCRPQFVDGIFEDLHWLGLDWDGDVVFQSDRSSAYADALDRLRAMDLVYRCWCSRAEISASAGAPQGDVGPTYPGTCKGRSSPTDSRPHCWRLDSAKAAVVAGPLIWREYGRGAIDVDPALFGDVVIARKDAETSYHLAVVVDDAAQGVSDVARGADLQNATHIHRLLQNLLGYKSPRYHHHGLIVGQDGVRLAKRKASPTIQSMRDAGVDPVGLMRGLRSGVFPVGFGLARG